MFHGNFSLPNWGCSVGRSTTARVLPAAVFDALELSALIHGGIGAGMWWVWEWEGGTIGGVLSSAMPYCAEGHANFLDGGLTRRPVARALTVAGICVGTNDDAVRAINKRRRSGPSGARVPFRLWTRHLEVQRGA